MELSNKARQARNAYAREYRKKNRDKIREYNRRYWEKQAGNELPEQARKLYNQGYSQREIAEVLDLSLGTVNRLLNKF